MLIYHGSIRKEWPKTNPRHVGRSFKKYFLNITWGALISPWTTLKHPHLGQISHFVTGATMTIPCPEIKWHVHKNTLISFSNIHLDATFIPRSSNKHRSKFESESCSKNACLQTTQWKTKGTKHHSQPTNSVLPGTLNINLLMAVS